MWLFTPYGFFSIVRAWKDADTPEPNPGKLMIRVRVMQHLVNLIDVCPLLDGEQYDCIVGTPGRDYAFRLILDDELVERTVEWIVEAIDYTNFKQEAATEMHDETYDHVLHEVHGCTLDLEHPEHIGRRRR